MWRCGERGTSVLGAIDYYFFRAVVVGIPGLDAEAMNSPDPRPKFISPM